MKIAIVVGTRPEIIKMAPVILELQRNNISFFFIHTGQHYDFEMSKIFLDELCLPKPHKSFVLENFNPAAQIGEMMIKLESVLETIKPRPEIMLIQGDTNSMLAAGLTALKLKMKLGHIEAGLRSYDWRMPEEHNRRMIDHVSDYLFAPTDRARLNLVEERVEGEIYVTGNTVIDAIEIYFDNVKNAEEHILSKVRFERFALVTFHRSENVDDPNTLRNFVKILSLAPIPIVFPIHPRTKRRLYEYGLWNTIENITHLQILPPLGYFEFLALMRNAEIILTDSGGLQEEATHPRIRKPVLVLRTSTERPEAIEAGFARIVGVNPTVVLSEINKVITEKRELPSRSPFGDGKASQKIVKILREKIAT